MATIKILADKENVTMVLDGKTVGIHELARKMLADGFFGQGLANPAKAETYILLAADDPNVESTLPPSGFNFWRYAIWHYRVFKARRNLQPIINAAISDKS